MNSYKILFKSKSFEISSEIEAENKYRAALLAVKLFKKDSLMPTFFKHRITVRNINVIRIYKTKT